MAIIYAGTNGYLDAVPVAELRAFEMGLYQFMEGRHPAVLRGIVEKRQLDDQLKGALDAAVKEFAGEFAGPGWVGVENDVLFGGEQDVGSE